MLKKNIYLLITPPVILSMLCSILLRPAVLASTLGPSDLHSIYEDSVWYDPSVGTGATSCTSLSGLPAGNGAPDGASFPNLDPAAMANAINTWILKENSNSEMKGLGSTVVAGAQNSNVNPFLIVAIAHEESSLSDPSDFNVSHGNNSFGRTATASQPNFQGSRLWYKWSSVKASVDNTAPENQNASGGGDIAAYLRDQYGSQLDSNNLTAVFLEYAPPGENNTEQYINNVQSWINDLVQLSGQPGSSTGTTSGCGTAGSDCAGGASGNAAILCEAKKYEGIFYLFGGGHEAYSTFRQICPEASIPAAAAASTEADPGPCATDCSGLISVAVDAAFGLSYTWSIDGTMVGSGSQYWQSIPIDQAKAGDIVTTSEHVEIVDHIQGDTVYTFGSHETGTKTGQVTTSKGYWTSGAYHWTGPGSNG